MISRVTIIESSNKETQFINRSIFGIQNYRNPKSGSLICRVTDLRIDDLSRTERPPEKVFDRRKKKHQYSISSEDSRKWENRVSEKRERFVYILLLQMAICFCYIENSNSNFENEDPKQRPVSQNKFSNSSFVQYTS